jgi:hypothetical protein
MRAYMKELRTEVLRQLREGKSVEEIKQPVKIEKYRDWRNYKECLPLNIEGMVRIFKCTASPTKEQRRALWPQPDTPKHSCRSAR